MSGYWSVGLFWVCLVTIAAFEFLLPQRPDADRVLRWPTNLTFGAINVAIAPLVPLSGVLAADWAHQRGVGLLNGLTGAAVGWELIVVLLATALIRSSFNYLTHFAFHKIPILWRIHRVHHLDTALDVSTGLRSHPVELIIALSISVPTSIVFGLHPVGLVLYETLEQLFSLFTHANLIVTSRLDSMLRWVIVTPLVHSVHHSSFPYETDSNYGAVLTLWDRLFGTYCELKKDCEDDFEIGLREVRDARASMFWWQLLSPLIRFEQVPASPGKGLTAPGS